MQNTTEFDLTPYLKLLVEQQGSDLFFTTGAPAKIKIEGVVNPVGKTVLTRENTEAAAHGIMEARYAELFNQHGEVDFAFSLPENGARFRANVFRQRGDTALCLRRIPTQIPGLDELGLPDVLKQIIMHKRGLILMTGATGSGKSTTLASMIQYRNTTVSDHILTIEDPVEFYHPNLKSIVNQREVGVDTRSYQDALKSAMRESPDVILIGEARDRQTMEAALELCNTGHLCLTTLHSNNAHQTLERIINLFPREFRHQLLMDLALNIRAVISQRLVRCVDGKRCAAVEVLVNTPHIADLIHKGEIDKLKEAMESSGAKGMQTFDSALHALYKCGRIGLEEALINADSRMNLEAKINFG
jgi:twitching motility protein PilU